MGKSSDHRSEIRERVTDANKVPLGRPGFFSGTKPAGASSMLKPSYLMGNEYSSSANMSSSSNSSSMVTSFANLNQHIPGISASNSSTISGNSSKQAADYSRWSESPMGSYMAFSSQKSSKLLNKRDND
ncbi:unnamed protein product, partial [Allacma fusca]